ncbi:hypothetical protein D9758_006774 [Tetrapyrgos nigripes]|uniref:Uncharacterized protein n=1 Tax=Tetrapyrgos nigripes TaxID=182062 RepID=A0A8H5CVH0_9AGAR|nr:hypothetical protein D9758_006774 [Tetrapyrgos nigripes]
MASRRRRLASEGSRPTDIPDESTEFRKWDSEDEDFIGPQPESSSSFSSKPKSSKNSYDPYGHAYKQDYEFIWAEQEDKRFRDKLSMAFEDDERLDSVEARFNSFAHVPMHWGGAGSRGGTGSGIDYESIDPMTLDQEEYVEWIRQGMYRKTHAHEFEEKERKKAEHAARRAQEKALQEETERLEKAAAEERRRRRHEREHRKWEHVRELYDNRWKELLAPIPPGDTATPLSFDDVPWPVHLSTSASKSDKDKDKNSKSRAMSVSVALEDLTRDAISLFLFSTTSSSSSSSSSNKESSEWEKEKKDRRDKLRETFLRFHPDKFEGRFMPRVKEAERDKVRQALGIVVRALNELMEQGG